jgi:F-type H+-transporting ATPase subunit delta
MVRLPQGRPASQAARGGRCFRGGRSVKPVLIAGRYAKALAQVVGENDAKALEAAAAQLDLLARVLARDPSLARFFDSPVARPADKKKALETLATKAKLSDVMQRFMGVVVEKRRAAAIGPMAEAFGEIRDRAAGVVPVEATVAVEMGDKETKQFRETLETMTGRKVRLSVKVDPEIVGGVKARIGSRVFDGTLESHLRTLHRRLAEAR